MWVRVWVWAQPVTPPRQLHPTSAEILDCMHMYTHTHFGNSLIRAHAHTHIHTHTHTCTHTHIHTHAHSHTHFVQPQLVTPPRQIHPTSAEILDCMHVYTHTLATNLYMHTHTLCAAPAGDPPSPNSPHVCRDLGLHARVHTHTHTHFDNSLMHAHAHTHIHTHTHTHIHTHAHTHTHTHTHTNTHTRTLRSPNR